jgi:uncharacterized SAM-binding protein YcdF (DUF218 family)
MFVFLSKFLPLFVYPVGLACVLLLAALIFNKHRRIVIPLVVIALAILYIGGNRWVAVSLVRSLEWRYLPLSTIPNEAAIVVLGGGTEADQPPRPSVEVNGAGDRVIYAAQLYKEGKAPHLLLSGGTITWQGTRSSTPAQDMADLLELMGVPQSALWLQNRSQNTYEDALYSSEMLKQAGIQRVILVTSAMHMPRAVPLFEAQGIQVIPAPCDYTVTAADWQDLNHPNIETFFINLIPTASNLKATSGAMKEYIGLWVYEAEGWTGGD